MQQHWVGGLIGMSLVACGPDVTVGDLGSRAGSGGVSQVGGAGGASALGGGGSASALGGAPDSGGGDSGAGGVASNDAGAGSGGMGMALQCAADLMQIVPGPTVACPDDIPEELQPCELPAYANCIWQIGIDEPEARGYQAMGCYEYRGSKVWSGFSGSVGSGNGGVNNEQCPRQEVEPGVSCGGHEGQLCEYPTRTCLCDAALTEWQCELFPDVLGLGLTQQVHRLCVDFDESKLVKELTEQEVRDWCRWSLSPLDQPIALELLAPTAPPYDAADYGTIYGDLFGQVCRPVLPLDACVANFGAAPDCDATVAELDECAETLMVQKRRVGRGCEALLENPSCAGLFALRTPNGAACPLPFPE